MLKNEYASTYNLNQLKLAQRISNSNNGNNINQFLLDFRKEEYNICGDNVTPLLFDSDCNGQLQYAYLFSFCPNIPTITCKSYNNSIMFNLLVIVNIMRRKQKKKEYV